MPKVKGSSGKNVDERAHRTQAARRAETRAQIRAAAWELFTSEGFEATTTQAIAKRAGVAAGTVFLHASDKEDLLFLVMHDRLSEVIAERLDSVPDAPLLEQLLHVFAGIFQMYGEHPDVAAAFVRHSPGADGPNARVMWTMTFGFIHRVGLLIAEAQARGEVSREVEANACAQNVFGLYFMALMAWLNGHVSLEAALDPLLRNALALQMRGFRP